MIMLDTHIWVQWTLDITRLTPAQIRAIADDERGRIGVSVISCWEVAKSAQINRLQFAVPVSEWMDTALRYPGVELLDLTPEIAVASTQLPGDFHRDPSDQIIVATARAYQCPLVTSDRPIRQYPYVDTIY